MDDVDDWQSIDVGDSNSEFKAGPSTIPMLPFPAYVETCILKKNKVKGERRFIRNPDSHRSKEENQTMVCKGINETD